MSWSLNKLMKKAKKTYPICSVVVPAAGSATRMEGINKILTTLDGTPILALTLQALEQCPLVTEIIVVTRRDLIVVVSQLCREFQISKATKVIVGGECRLDSVFAGVQEVRSDADLIAIHDGARPFPTQALLHEVFSCGATKGAAAPAVPLVDTIKQAKAGVVEKTIDRSGLWAIQTPQVFEASLIRGALQQAITDNAVLTDDCSAVERLGMKVAITQGEQTNLKITTPFDLMVGLAILQSREGF